MNIVIGPIRAVREGIAIAPEGANPGIGGTEFQTALLASALSDTGVFGSVTLVTVGPPIGLPSKNVTVLSVAAFEEFVAPKNSVVILPMSSLTLMTPHQLRGARVIAQSHHPHDPKLEGLSRQYDFDAVVSVGQYAFMSNVPRTSSPHVYIPNIFSPDTPQKPSEKDPSSPVIVGHVSSMTPWKRFIDVAKIWPDIVALLPGARLEVIGGSSLYSGGAEAHPFLPTDLDYGRRIEAKLGESISSVSFLGRVDDGIDHITGKWTVAIINPRGISEADPASFKDMARVGVPALSGFDYGLVDYLTSFPELRIKKIRKLPRQVRAIVNDSEKREDLSDRLLALSTELAKKNQAILSAWVELVQFVSSKDKTPSVGSSVPHFFDARVPISHRIRLRSRNRKT